MASYCEFVKDLTPDNPNYIHKIYHDTEYGFSVTDDNKLFERLVLEINQAGLSWTTILKKKDNFIKAYDNFEISKVAAYEQKDIDRLLLDAGIIRNKLKINAAIKNAQKIIELQKSHSSFYNWIESNRGLSKEEWVALFKKNFLFTGGEIVNEFLMSIGVLPGAHDVTCRFYTKTI